MAADGSRPARPGATSAQPFVRVEGEADGCHRIITSHAPEDGCTDCAPAIVDGWNGCPPATLPKMAAVWPAQP